MSFTMKFRQPLIVVLIGVLWCGFFAHADSSLTREQFFTSYVDVVSQNSAPSQSYTGIVLKYKGIVKNTPIYQTMQKAVSYKLFPNASLTLPLTSMVTEDKICAIVKRTFAITSSCTPWQWASSSRLDMLLYQVQILQKQQNAVLQIKLTSDWYLDVSSLNQISDVLNTSDLNAKNISEKYTIYSTIQSMVDGANDPYTVFFPPTEAQQFNEELEGEFEGIWAYVEMTKPGELIITAPIGDSPAEEAGLEAWDRILKIDEHRITSKIDITTAVSWIKWPAGTDVTLLVLRNKKSLTFTLTRAAVTVKNVVAKTYSGTTCYMSIGMFGYGVSSEFATAMAKVFGKNKCKKYIFDVRNNPGWSLEEVSNILSYFVPTGEPTVFVDSTLWEENLVASAIDGNKLTNKKLVILINQSSASASEIFAWTIKDYIPSTSLIGETSYGKWSVQELTEYPDGSMLKHTIAKWFTGKSKTTIDHIGIKPDVQIFDDPTTIADEQLQAALKN